MPSVDLTINIATLIGFGMTAISVAYAGGKLKQILTQVTETQKEHEQNIVYLRRQGAKHTTRIAKLETWQDLELNHKEASAGR